LKVKYIKPTFSDIPKIQKMILNDVKSGILLSRSNDEIAKNIRSYFLAKNNNEYIGLVSLQIHTIELAEIRSLFVQDEFRGQGVGKILVSKATKEAKKLGIKQLLTLTYQRDFFQKLNFNEIAKVDIPNHKIWEDCIKCKFYPNCDEIAMLKNINFNN
jgi:amino-acid N-acetyltransferase